VLRPSACSYIACAAFVGFCVLASCSSYWCGMISESMSLIGSDSKWCFAWSLVLSCW